MGKKDQKTAERESRCIYYTQKVGNVEKHMKNWI